MSIKRLSLSLLLASLSSSSLLGPKSFIMSSSRVLAYPTGGRLEATKLVARYKRFLADVTVPQETTTKDGDVVNADGTIVVHCPNTGPMISLLPSCREDPLPCFVSEAKGGTKRKYRYTLEMVQIPSPVNSNVWVGVHSALANKIVSEALTRDLIQDLQGFTSLRKEVKLGDSTIDFELLWEVDGTVHKRVFLEVKSVTLAQVVGSELRAVFPDCVSERASRHAACLTTLMRQREAKPKQEDVQAVSHVFLFESPFPK
jgi:sugar fermentation stimulation protein